jgi:hypothetical protein
MDRVQDYIGARVRSEGDWLGVIKDDLEEEMEVKINTLVDQDFCLEFCWKSPHAIACFGLVDQICGIEVEKISSVQEFHLHLM